MQLADLVKVITVDRHGHRSGKHARSGFQCPEQQIPIVPAFTIENP